MLSIPTAAHVVDAISVGARARTVVAAGTHVAWAYGPGTVVAPYLDVEGNPVVVVDEEDAARMLEAGVAEARLATAPLLGTVLLSGSLEPFTGDHLDDDLRARLDDVLECPCEVHGDARLTMVRVVVEHVHITAPDHGSFARVDLADYTRASPDQVVSGGWIVAEHLNADHQGEVVRLAASLTGRPRREIVAASIGWVDALGVDLVVVDANGSEAVRAPFARPLTCIGDLTACLGDAGR